MHQDKLRTTVPNISHIVKDIRDLMCCANCRSYETNNHKYCKKTQPFHYCDKWEWDKYSQDTRNINAN